MTVLAIFKKLVIICIRQQNFLWNLANHSLMIHIYEFVCVCVCVHVCMPFVLNGCSMSCTKIYGVIHSWYIMDETEKDGQMIENHFETNWSLLIIFCILKNTIMLWFTLNFFIKKHGIASYRQEWKRKKLTEIIFLEIIGIFK